MKSLLIVGAGGFIGGFIAKRALELGYDVTVGVRATTSRRFLSDSRLKFLNFNYDDVQFPFDCHWDYIIYNLGATKCANFDDFERINCGYLRNFCEALVRDGMVPQKFLFTSSLSAVGPIDESSYSLISEQDTPHPNTRYGLSKIHAEQWLRQSSLPWIIFRPTGVYGPHEKDYLMMIKSIDSHVDFGVGFRKQMLTFIYVEDLVEAMFMALEKAPTHRIYNISEPRAYSQAEFRRIVADELGGKAVVPIRVPLWGLKAVSWVAQQISNITGKPSTLNLDKYHIMKQRNWCCTTDAARADFGFTAPTSLQQGIAKTVRAYKSDKNK